MKLQTVFLLVPMLTISGMQARAAQSPSEVLSSYGLIGTWSAACGQASGPRNPRFRFEHRPDGLVDNVGDYGVDGPSRSTVLDAFVDQDHRLHTTSHTTFAELPRQMREAVAKSGVTPDMTNRSIFSLGTDGSFNTIDQVVEIEGAPSTMHVVSNGFVVNQQTREAGPKVPPRFRCPE